MPLDGRYKEPQGTDLQGLLRWAQDTARLLRQGAVTGSTSWVSSRTDLKALPVTHSVIYLTEAGREGFFIWTEGDFTVHIATDTNEGVYIKAASEDASVGAWVRIFDFVHYWSKWFGTVLDHTTDNSTIINTIIEVTDLRNTLTTAGKQAAAYINIEGGVRFSSESLDFLPSGDHVFVYLRFFANSDLTKGVTDGGGGTNEYHELSVNSGYPGDGTGAMVAEFRHEAILHPSHILNVAKNIPGADDHFAASQVRIPTTTNPARASYNIKDENVLRGRMVYEGYGDKDTATGFYLQHFKYTVSLANVGSSGWAGIPANDTVFWGVTSGARAYKTGHGAPSIQGIWISGRFIPGEQITDGSTTSANGISGGGVTETQVTLPFLAFGVNSPAIVVGDFPGKGKTLLSLAGRLTIAPTNTGSASEHTENATLAGVWFTPDITGTAGRQAFLDANTRLVTRTGFALQTVGNGLVGACGAHTRFSHNAGSPAVSSNSFNVASIAHTGTGIYTVTFTTALANANYSIALLSTHVTDEMRWNSASTGSCEILCYHAGALANLDGTVMVSVLGGQ